jgi:photosystem II stability/assembly factor-like uncharacterized protein
MRMIHTVLIVLMALVGGGVSFANWQQIDSGTTAHLYDIHFWSKDKGIVAGANGTIRLTNDGGNSWVSSDTTGLPVTIYHSFNFFDEFHGFLFGGNGTVLTTLDGGSSWTVVNSGIDGNGFGDVAMVTAEIGIAVGGGGVILRTSDGGMTWEPRDSGTLYPLHAVAFMDSNIGVIGGEHVMLRTLDGGLTWSEVSQPMPNAWIYDIMLTKTGYGLAVCDFAAIKETHDGGATWSLVRSSLDDAELFSGVAIAGDGKAIAVGNFDLYRERALRTYDGGITWSPDPTGYGRSLRSVWYDGQTVWATGLQGDLFTADDPVSSVPAPMPGPRLHDAAPNPFNPQTVIAFYLPKQEIVSLRIFDVSGRLVRELVAGETMTMGRHETVWNGRDNTGRRVASGTYFYRLEAGEYSETKRMALIK